MDTIYVADSFITIAVMFDIILGMANTSWNYFHQPKTRKNDTEFCRISNAGLE